MADRHRYLFSAGPGVSRERAGLYTFPRLGGKLVVVVALVGVVVASLTWL